MALRYLFCKRGENLKASTSQGCCMDCMILKVVLWSRTWSVLINSWWPRASCMCPSFDFHNITSPSSPLTSQSWISKQSTQDCHHLLLLLFQTSSLSSALLVSIRQKKNKNTTPPPTHAKTSLFQLSYLVHFLHTCNTLWPYRHSSHRYIQPSSPDFVGNLGKRQVGCVASELKARECGWDRY